MVNKYYLRKEQHFELNDYCISKGIDFCSTPFSKEEVDLLNEIDVDFFKVASMDINNYPLLRYLAKFDKPILLSTGMSNLDEIEMAVKIIEDGGNSKIIILHCVAIYPPKDEDLNLRNIVMLQNKFKYPVGFSDHSLGVRAPLASVALGACIIEKHFTTDKELPGWDHEISANPKEMKKIVEDSKKINTLLGKLDRVVSKAEEEKKKAFRRSIVLNTNLKKGETIKEEHISLKRPGTGFSVDQIEFVIGKKLKRDYEADHLLTKDDIL